MNRLEQERGRAAAPGRRRDAAQNPSRNQHSRSQSRARSRIPPELDFHHGESLMERALRIQTHPKYIEALASGRPFTFSESTEIKIPFIGEHQYTECLRKVIRALTIFGNINERKNCHICLHRMKFVYTRNQSFSPDQNRNSKDMKTIFLTDILDVTVGSGSGSEWIFILKILDQEELTFIADREQIRSKFLAIFSAFFEMRARFEVNSLLKFKLHPQHPLCIPGLTNNNSRYFKHTFLGCSQFILSEDDLDRLVARVDALAPVEQVSGRQRSSGVRKSTQSPGSRSSEEYEPFEESKSWPSARFEGPLEQEESKDAPGAQDTRQQQRAEIQQRELELARQIEECQREAQLLKQASMLRKGPMIPREQQQPMSPPPREAIVRMKDRSFKNPEPDCSDVGQRQNASLPMSPREINFNLTTEQSSRALFSGGLVPPDDLSSIKLSTSHLELQQEAFEQQEDLGRSLPQIPREEFNKVAKIRGARTEFYKPPEDEDESHHSPLPVSFDPHNHLQATSEELTRKDQEVPGLQFHPREAPVVVSSDKYVSEEDSSLEDKAAWEATEDQRSAVVAESLNQMKSEDGLPWTIKQGQDLARVASTSTKESAGARPYSSVIIPDVRGGREGIPNLASTHGPFKMSSESVVPLPKPTEQPRHSAPVNETNEVINELKQMLKRKKEEELRKIRQTEEILSRLDSLQNLDQAEKTKLIQMLEDLDGGELLFGTTASCKDYRTNRPPAVDQNGFARYQSEGCSEMKFEGTSQQESEPEMEAKGFCTLKSSETMSKADEGSRGGFDTSQDHPFTANRQVKNPYREARGKQVEQVHLNLEDVITKFPARTSTVVKKSAGKKSRVCHYQEPEPASSKPIYLEEIEFESLPKERLSRCHKEPELAGLQPCSINLKSDTFPREGAIHISPQKTPIQPPYDDPQSRTPRGTLPGLPDEDDDSPPDVRRFQGLNQDLRKPRKKPSDKPAISEHEPVQNENSRQSKQQFPVMLEEPKRKIVFSDKDEEEEVPVSFAGPGVGGAGQRNPIQEKVKWAQACNPARLVPSPSKLQKPQAAVKPQPPVANPAPVDKPPQRRGFIIKTKSTHPKTTKNASSMLTPEFTPGGEEPKKKQGNLYQLPKLPKDPSSKCEPRQGIHVPIKLKNPPPQELASLSPNRPLVQTKKFLLRSPISKMRAGASVGAASVGNASQAGLSVNLTRCNRDGSAFSGKFGGAPVSQSSANGAFGHRTASQLDRDKSRNKSNHSNVSRKVRVGNQLAFAIKKRASQLSQVDPNEILKGNILRKNSPQWQDSDQSSVHDPRCFDDLQDPRVSTQPQDPRGRSVGHEATSKVNDGDRRLQSKKQTEAASKDSAEGRIGSSHLIQLPSSPRLPLNTGNYLSREPLNFRASPDPKKTRKTEKKSPKRMIMMTECEAASRRIIKDLK